MEARPLHLVANKVLSPFPLGEHQTGPSGEWRFLPSLSSSKAASMWEQ